MSFSDLLRRILILFLVMAVILPISSTFLFLFGLILGSLGDGTGKSVLNALSIGFCGLWGMSLAAILLLLTVDKVIQDQ